MAQYQDRAIGADVSEGYDTDDGFASTGDGSIRWGQIQHSGFQKIEKDRIRADNQMRARRKADSERSTMDAQVKSWASRTGAILDKVDGGYDHRKDSNGRKQYKPKRGDRNQNASIKMELFRIEVGKKHDVKPGNIVGAIANETGIDGNHIARIKIEENYSTVELPAGMPKDLFQELKKVRVAGQQLNISTMDPSAIKKAKSKKRMSSTSRRGKQKDRA